MPQGTRMREESSKRDILHVTHPQNTIAYKLSLSRSPSRIFPSTANVYRSPPWRSCRASRRWPRRRRRPSCCRTWWRRMRTIRADWKRDFSKPAKVRRERHGSCKRRRRDAAGVEDACCRIVRVAGRLEWNQMESFLPKIFNLKTNFSFQFVSLYFKISLVGLSRIILMKDYWCCINKRYFVLLHGNCQFF